MEQENVLRKLTLFCLSVVVFARANIPNGRTKTETATSLQTISVSLMAATAAAPKSDNNNEEKVGHANKLKRTNERQLFPLSLSLMNIFSRTR